MPDRPIIALRVSDVAASAAFFTERLGFQHAGAHPPAGTAIVLDLDGDALLLVGPGVADPAPYLSAIHVIHKPGDILRDFGRDIDALHDELARRGVVGMRYQETSWGDRKLIVPAPDDYVMEFVAHTQRSPEELLTLYLRGPDALEDALAGLAEPDYDLAPAPTEWSIRQIIHHIADGDDIWALPTKVALASPGATYRNDWYTPDNAWARLLDYTALPVAPSLALLRASRAQIAALIRHLPGAWDRGVQYHWPGATEPRAITVGQIIRTQAIHPFAHADEIRVIRERHGK